MLTLLRWLAEWKGRRRSAQVIVFDGGAEVERNRAFLRGFFAGGGAVLVAVLVTAPATPDRVLAQEAERRALLLREAEGRAAQAVSLARTCLGTAQVMEATLRDYRAMVEAYPGVIYRR